MSSEHKIKILIIRLSSLGDLFHALPVVHQLKEHYNADIDWVTHPEYIDLLSCFTDIRRAIAFPRKKVHKYIERYIKEVRAERYDYIIDLQGLLKSAIAGRLARGGKQIGPSYQREGARLFYHAVAGPKNKNRHAVEENLDVLDYLGIPRNGIRFPVHFPAAELGGIAPRVAMVPCSRWPTKNWPAARFVETGRQLKEQGVNTFYILGGAEDVSICQQIADGIGTDSAINMSGKTTLLELGGLLQQMDLVITVDSGPMHIASALQIPTVAVFGATNPDRTGPYGRHATVFLDSLNCRPCYSRTCKREDLACLEKLMSEQVVQAAKPYLSAKEQR